MNLMLFGNLNGFYICERVSQAKLNLTKHFTNPELQNHSISELYEVQKRRSADFVARNPRSG